jgi:hypothetical protein
MKEIFTIVGTKGQARHLVVDRNPEPLSFEQEETLAHSAFRVTDWSGKTILDKTITDARTITSPILAAIKPDSPNKFLVS